MCGELFRRPLYPAGVEQRWRWPPMRPNVRHGVERRALCAAPAETKRRPLRALARSAVTSAAPAALALGIKFTEPVVARLPSTGASLVVAVGAMRVARAALPLVALGRPPRANSNFFHRREVALLIVVSCRPARLAGGRARERGVRVAKARRAHGRLGVGKRARQTTLADGRGGRGHRPRRARFARGAGGRRVARGARRAAVDDVGDPRRARVGARGHRARRARAASR